MSDDLVNQITLNFLISKHQLQKLNKKIKQKEEDGLKTDMEIYKDQIVELFTKMINDELPDDLLEDVKHSYNYFIEKSIYYLKMRLQADTSASDKTVASLEEEETVASLEDEEDEEEEDKSSSNKEDEDEDEEETVASLEEEKPACPTVYKKTNKNTKSKGVDDIQQLPLDWFNKVRQSYKQNQIIPRQKDKEFVLESPTNYKNIEKKNISNLYEVKTKNKKDTK